MRNEGLGTPWVWTGCPSLSAKCPPWLPYDHQAELILAAMLEGEGRLVVNTVCIDMVLLLPVGPGPCPPVTSSPVPLPPSALPQPSLPSTEHKLMQPQGLCTGHSSHTSHYRL